MDELESKIISVFARMDRRYVLRNFIIVLLVTMCLIPSLVKTRSYGVFASAKLYALGVFPEKSDEFLEEKLTYDNMKKYVNSLITCGDTNSVTDFYRTIGSGTTPNFYLTSSGLAIQGDEYVSAEDAYGIILNVAGIFEQGTDNKTVSARELASKVGFGFLTDGVYEANHKLVNGEFGDIIYEFILMRPSVMLQIAQGEGYASEFALSETVANKTVYRILGGMNNRYKEALLNNGLYDDLPEDIAPIVDVGYFEADSYASLPGADDRFEWTASYTNISQEIFEQYITKVDTAGWELEGRYVVRDDLESDYFKLTTPASSKEEAEAFYENLANATPTALVYADHHMAYLYTKTEGGIQYGLLLEHTQEGKVVWTLMKG